MLLLIPTDISKVQEMDIGFAIGARATKATENFRQMKDIVKAIIAKYGRTKIRYSIIVVSDEPVVKISFGDSFPSDEDLKRRLDMLPAPSGKGAFIVAPTKAFKQ